jgi:steroid delta-isomerase-like uncharacterized protein
MRSSIILRTALFSAFLVIVSSFTREKGPFINQFNKEVKMTTNPVQEKNKEIIRKLYEEILNTGRLELLNQVVSRDYAGPRGIKGPLGFAESIQSVRSAFPDIKWTIEDLIAEDNKIVVRWTWKGTNKASFDGFPVTNREVIHSAINIFEFRDDKISKSWMQSDRLGFYQQIGVISAGAVTPPVK